METIVTIDKAGRIVVPKPVREELQLEPGDSLALTCEVDQLVLRHITAEAPLKKERGVWVYQGTRPLSLEEVNRAVAAVRRHRSRLPADLDRR